MVHRASSDPHGAGLLPSVKSQVNVTLIFSFRTESGGIDTPRKAIHSPAPV